jgi:hypothetical protein
VGSIDSILLTHAELAIALAGFASVAAVLRRPLSAIQRQRFFTILFSSLFQVFFSILPLWLAELEIVGSGLWRTASALYLALMFPLLLFAVYLPLRKLGARSFAIINSAATYIVYGLIASVVGLLVTNLLVSAPGFGLYYAALFAGLSSVFLVFADVVVTGDGETS